MPRPGDDGYVACPASSRRRRLGDTRGRAARSRDVHRRRGWYGWLSRGVAEAVRPREPPAFPSDPRRMMSDSPIPRGDLAARPHRLAFRRSRRGARNLCLLPRVRGVARRRRPHRLGSPARRPTAAPPARDRFGGASGRRRARGVAGRDRAGGHHLLRPARDARARPGRAP